MSDLVDIYEDSKAWSCFEGETEHETIGVYRRCHCGRYITRGRLQMNPFSEVKLTNWICKVHGEVTPYWDRWDDE